EKGEAQRAVSVFAKYYTPSVIAVAVFVALVPSLITGEWSIWIYRGLILLVAACPCAVVISAPLAFFSSMGACAKSGIIIKGSRFIESMAAADTAVFDKTGTLTTGELTVGKIHACEGFNEEKVIYLAAKCELFSTHPIAKAIVKKSGIKSSVGISDFSETAGGGTSIVTEEGNILCGGKRLMIKAGIDVSSLPELPVYVAVNSRLIGGIEVDGEIRTDCAKCIENLKKLGIKRVVMLTGDGEEQARKISCECGIAEYKCNLLPEDKLNEVKRIKENAKGTIYVGDGINDAPVLAASDTGVAMGLGTQAAGEAADVILTSSVISKLAVAVAQSKKTMNVLKSNIAFAVVVKIAVIALGIAGIAPMWLAIVADVGTMLVCVANSSRLLRVGDK
ncbi:MAG: HAD-IC family P-type ATPase, partial [Clostridia bacterium]|nr:HAD-IC family P-type ATPase [Clostridia bacterium]